MKGFFITLCVIAAFIALTLVIRLKFELSAENGKLFYRLSMAGKTFLSSEKKKRPKKRKRKKEPPKAKKPPFERLKEENPVMRGMLKSIFKMPKMLASRVIIEKLYLDLALASDDAAKTAESYGYACAAIYSLDAALNKAFKIKDEKISVIPDFKVTQTRYSAEIRISLKIFDLLVIMWALLLGLLEILIKRKLHKIKNNKKQGGAKHV